MTINLRVVRRAKEVTQAELSEKSGVSVSTITDIERGARDNIEITTLMRLAKALDCDLDDLVG